MPLTGRAWAAWLVLATPSVGCTERVVLPALDNPDGWRTEVLMLGSDTEPTDVYVFAADDPSAVADLPLDDAVVRAEAWLLDAPPEVWGLAIGRVQRLDGSAPPAAHARAFITELVGDRPQWTTDEPRWRDRLRVAVMSPEACVAAGGCYLAPDDLACTAPCPTPPTPTEPALPEWTPRACPAGWAPTTSGLTCRPWMGQPSPSCGPAEAAFPSSATCTRLGRVCPSAGDWPEVPAGPVSYVRGTAPAGGDGTRAAPFRTLDEALLSGAARIAVGAGDYRTDLALRDVHISGACPEQTTITSAGRWVLAGEVTLDNASIEVAGLTVTGTAALTALHLTTGEPSSIEGTAALSKVRFETRGDHESTLTVGAGASLAAEHLMIDAAQLGAVLSTGYAAMRLEDVVVTRAVNGISLHEGRAPAQLRQIVVIAPPRVALSLRAGDGDVDDLYVSSPLSPALRYREGARGTAAGVLVEGGTATDIEIISGANVRLRNVEGLRDAAAARSGPMLYVRAATAAVEGLHLRDVRFGGVGAYDAALTLTDADVTDSGEVTAMLDTRDAISASEGTRMRGARIRVTGGSGAGISSFVNAVAELEDISIASTGSCVFCGGLCASNRGNIVAARVRLRAVRGGGVRAFGHSTLVATDLEVSGVSVSPNPTCGDDGGMGRALMADAGSAVTLERFVISGAASAGVAAFAYADTPATIDLRRGAIRDNQIGLLLGDAGYDLRRALVEVSVTGNRVAIQAVSE